MRQSMRKYSVTDEVPSYFKISERGKNILNILDMTYERACMDTQEEEYCTNMLKTIIEHNDRTKTQFPKEKNQQAINMIVA